MFDIYGLQLHYSLGKLDDDFIIEFSTSPAKVLQFSPYGMTSTLRPKCLLLFDQKIDIHAILKHLIVINSEGHIVKSDDIELLDEATAMNEFKWFTTATDGNREKYVAFTFKNDLSRATQYAVDVPVGCPSAEGILTSTEAWSGSFQTYEPLKIVDWSPNTNNTWQPSAAPGQHWSLTFSNSLDHSTINKALFKIEPDLAGLGELR
jgi:hypothetical protein